VGSSPPPESLVSFAHAGVVPHIVFKSPRLQLGELESPAAKRYLRQFVPEAQKHL
jgi:hypothetical protein